MSVAVLFPGQGGQTPGFLHRMPVISPVHHVFTEASSVLGFDVLSLDSEAALSSTVATQLGLVIAGAAFWKYLACEGVSVRAVAGMSVGTYSAAFAAGSISLATALTLVRRRAELMQERFPGGTHGLAAVQGLRLAQVEDLLQDSRLSIANFNSPTQFVVAGRVSRLESFMRRAEAAGASKVLLLKASVPSHISELASSSRELRQLAEQLPVDPPDETVFLNGDARPILTAEGVREELAFNMTRPVRWHDIMGVITGFGITLCIESPPGHALTGLVAETAAGVRALSAAEIRWDVLLRAAAQANAS